MPHWIIRQAYDAFARRDTDRLRRLLADSTIFHEPSDNPISGDYQGIDQVLGYFRTLAERSGGTFRVNVHDVVANHDVETNDEHVVGLHFSEAEREGHRLNSPTVLVFHVRDGRITETWAHHYDQHEWDEFWY